MWLLGNLTFIVYVLLLLDIKCHFRVRERLSKYAKLKAERKGKEKINSFKCISETLL